LWSINWTSGHVGVQKLAWCPSVSVSAEHKITMCGLFQMQMSCTCSSWHHLWHVQYSWSSIPCKCHCWDKALQRLCIWGKEDKIVMNGTAIFVMTVNVCRISYFEVSLKIVTVLAL